jgi:ABC-2 type transport system permease protein
MNRFGAFVKKEFFHIFRDYRTLIILFGIPIAQILIFGFVVSNEIRDVRIGILDNSRDNVTSAIIDKLISSGYFIIDRNLEGEAEIEAAFREGKIKEVIIFEPDFEKNLNREGVANLRIVADASDANTGNLIANYTQGIVMNYLTDINKEFTLPYTINPVPRMYFNQLLQGVYMFVPGTMALILILISAIMTSITIAREKESGTMETLLVSPLRPSQIILGKVTPYVLLAYLNAVFIIVLGYFVFGVPVSGNIMLLMLANVLYVSLALSIGIFISTLVSTQQSAMFISMLALMLPTMLLSGFIFPIENMPEILQWLSIIMPARWFVSLLKHVMIKGTGFIFIWKELLILTLMTLFFIILSIKRFKIRLE